jgi:hypothetical protein
MSLEKASQDLVAAITNLIPGTRGSLVGAQLQGANLAGRDLRREDLSTADLDGADLSAANLAGAVFRDADLPNANLAGANLTGANLHGADLSNADLTGAIGLDTVDFEYAFATVDTVWPADFEVGDKVMILRPPTAGSEPESLPRRISARMREQAHTLRDRLRSAD